MKIACPECSAHFDVPVDLIGQGGRRVRCNNCGNIWMQDPTPQPGGFGGFRAMEQEDDIDPIPASVHPRDNDDEDDEEGGPGLLSGTNWGLLGKMMLGFVLGLGLLTAITYALSVAHMVPGFLKPVAARMGMEEPSPTAGLEISDVVARPSDGLTVVTGKVTNTTDAEIKLPALEITPIDADGTEAEGKRITLPQESLKAGENMTFGAEVQGVLEDSGAMRVRFVE